VEPDWNELAGELRSALAARNWGEAGAVIWRLRQLDQERYTLELEHYTNQQVGKGGRGVALETEQRLEAVRQWVRECLEGEHSDKWRTCFEQLLGGVSKKRAQPSVFHEGDYWSDYLPYSTSLAWEGQAFGVGEKENYAEFLRQDMADVIWSVFVEAGEPDK
jgi:hypothetical protein